MTTADTTLDAASIEIELDLDAFESSKSPSEKRRWSLITYPLIAAISAFAAVGILQIGPKGLWDRAQAAIHVNEDAAPSGDEIVSTPVLVRPRPMRSIDERVARMTPRMEDHASRKHSLPPAIVAPLVAAPAAAPSSPSAPAHAAPAPPPPVHAAAPPPPAAPAPPPPPSQQARPGTRAPSTSLGIAGTPNADDVAAANAILQKAKGEHSF
jgi:hypothetical protein